MYRVRLLGCCLAVAFSPIALASTSDAVPSFSTPGAPGAEQEDEGKHPVRRLIDVGWDTLKSLRKGTIVTDFAPLHYRMGTKSIKTNFQYGVFETKLQVAYDGRLKFETSLPSLNGNVSFNVSAEPEHSTVYFINFRQQF